MEKIDHHRSDVVHKVDKVVPSEGTRTKCGVMLPHTFEVSPVNEDTEVTCGNCQRIN